MNALMGKARADGPGTGVARAFWVTAPGRGEILDTRLPVRSDTDVLIRTCFSGVSRGTEALVFAGRVPVSERQRMRAPFQEGEFPGPVKYGYANVGMVEDGPPGLLGRYVFSLFPHQTEFVLPVHAAHPLPAGVPPARAVLAANLETAINGVWDAAPQPGDRVLVIGAGTVGCLVAWLVESMVGVSCVVSDINRERAAVAGALGVEFVHPDGLSEDWNLIVHASGSEAGLRRALEVAAADATILEMSWFGDRLVSLPLGQAFHARRLTLKSSQVGALPPDKRADWTLDRRLDRAISLLADPALDALITSESAFEELPRVMAELASQVPPGLMHRVRY
jgi:NADPH:quinone reductase-like Zn-dependent oxidoreductase